MPLLALVCSWVYGPDVATLGDPVYATRAAATRRLEAAGLWVYPLLWQNLSSPCPERAQRCEGLMAKVPTAGWFLDALPGRCAAALLDADKDAIPDEVLYRLVDPLCRVMAERHGEVAYFKTSGRDGPGVRAWVDKPPHFAPAYSPAGDLRTVVEYVRLHRKDAHRRALDGVEVPPPPAGVPMVMPVPR